MFVGRGRLRRLICLREVGLARRHGVDWWWKWAVGKRLSFVFSDLSDLRCRLSTSTRWLGGFHLVL